MATAKVAFRKMKEICLALPDTREGLHFGKAGFYVKGKLFATCEGEGGRCEITFGLEPTQASALVASDPRFQPYPRDRRGVILDAAQVTSWSEVKALVLKSYELVKPRSAKKAGSQSTSRRAARR